jgi:hypothetical protein
MVTLCAVANRAGLMPQHRFAYVDQVPHARAVLSLYEMTDLILLARRCTSLGELLRSLTPEQSAWLLDVANLLHRAGYREGAKAAADSSA